jgi:Tol biopolymer transport system component
MNNPLLRRRVLLAACIFLAALPPLDAGEKTLKLPITLEDLWKVKRLGKPSISPDGAWVAVDVTTFRMDDNSSNSQIWLCSTDGKTQKQLTNNKASSSGPLWSPDGKSIAFTSKRGDSTQIYVISPDGGEARQVSKLPMAPSGLKWGADSKSIYCVVWTWPDTPDDESYKKKEKAKKDDKVQAYIIDDALYRVWDHWIADGKRPVVFAVDAATGKHKNLFAGVKRTLPVSGGSAADYDVSPDGKEICFTSESAKELGMDYNLDLYVMPLDKKAEPKNITADNPANDFAPVYRTDGKEIAFLRQTTKFFYADRVRIMLHRKKRGENLDLTEKWDQSYSSVTSELLCETEYQGYRLLYIFAGNGFLSPEGYSDVSPSIARNGSPQFNSIAFLRSRFDLPASLYTTAIGIGWVWGISPH